MARPEFRAGHKQITAAEAEAEGYTLTNDPNRTGDVMVWVPEMKAGVHSSRGWIDLESSLAWSPPPPPTALTLTLTPSGLA